MKINKQEIWGRPAQRVRRYYSVSTPYVKSEGKQTQNLISFDPAKFEVSKIYQGDVQFLNHSAQLFFYSLFTNV